MKKMYLLSFSLCKAARRMVAFVILLFAFATAGICQCNTDYAYSAAYLISNSGDTALHDFQVKINVNTKDLVDAGKMNAAGDDIRFTDAACNNLDYWIESGINTDNTVIWVKVNNIEASGSTQLIMYSGNATAIAASNGNNTFESFDDFESGSLAGWTMFGGATWSIESFNGSMRLKGSSLVEGNGSGALKYSGALQSYVIDADYYNDNSDAMGGPLFEFTNADNYYAVHSMTSPANLIMHSQIVDGYADYSTSWYYEHENNTWYKWTIVRSPEVNTVYFNNDSIGQLPRTFASGGGVWGYGSSNSVIYFDNVRVRKFSDKVSLSQTVLPVVLSSFSAMVKENNILVNWKILEETNVEKYEIEKSADGRSFSEATELPAKNTGNAALYSWTDTKPYSGANYYRLKIIDKDGSVSYSSIAKVATANNKPTVLIAPNPISGHTIHLQFTHLEREDYIVNLYSERGQKIYSTKLITSQENGAQAIQLPGNIAAGIYNLELSGKTLKTNLRVLVQ